MKNQDKREEGYMKKKEQQLYTMFVLTGILFGLSYLIHGRLIHF